MSRVETVKNLFEWNKRNLVSDAHLRKDDIARFFAADFLVKANGIAHDADYDNYYDFLNQFRKNIRSITYNLQEFIESKHTVVVPLSACIIRTNGQEDRYEAVLILKFDEHGKITLWHEVYVSVTH